MSYGKKEFRKRLLILTVLISLSFLVLLGRLWVLEIIQGEKYLFLARNNSIRLLPSRAPRGIIYDRKGEILARSRPSFSITIYPWNLSQEDLAETVKEISPIIGVKEERIYQTIEESQSPFNNIPLKEDVDLKTATKILERKLSLAGVDLQVQPRRYYPDEELLAPVLGYLGEIDKDQLQALRGRGYRLGDRVGRDGVERVYDEYLKGEDGGWQIRVNNRGQRVGTMGHKEPLPGNDLVLTIDRQLQQVAWDSLKGRPGAIVVLDPNNGEILSLVSAPAYDPNLFAGSLSQEKWLSLKGDPLHPLTNRAIQGEYPPGSAFKVITTIAALERGIASRDKSFFCSGTFPFKDRVFKCWKEEGCGTLNLKEAIIHSCNVYFYQLGLETGVDNIVDFSKEFGLGKASGIDLVEEKKGLLPHRRWRKESLSRKWFDGDTINLSIGQGYLLVTPLQMANLIGAIANGGRLYRPYLVKRIISPEGETIRETRPRLIKEVILKKKNLDLLRESLFGVVNEKGPSGRRTGTGWRAKIEGIEVAGKTGTAENPLGEDHAWFIGFAPYREPKIALAILVEHGGMGGKAAAPIAKRIFEAYFNSKVGEKKSRKVEE
ncbi:MAG TPA: penicillin-binding protein 2 [bacterium]|nr:penicillin-binding protein 2 [bacterium]